MEIHTRLWASDVSQHHPRNHRLKRGIRPSGFSNLNRSQSRSSRRAWFSERRAAFSASSFDTVRVTVSGTVCERLASPFASFTRTPRLPLGFDSSVPRFTRFRMAVEDTPSLRAASGTVSQTVSLTVSEPVCEPLPSPFVSLIETPFVWWANGVSL